MYVNLAFWLAVIYILHVPSTFLKSRRQLALGSDPWEHLDDDLYLIRRGLYQPPASQPASQHGLISRHYPVNFLNAFNYNHSILAGIIFISH